MNANGVPAVSSMLQGMDQSEFGQFVAALWKRQGWQTQVKRDDGKLFVGVQRPEAGEEGLLWAIPAAEGEVGGQQVQQFVSLCREQEIEESAIVSAGPMSDHAEKVAAGTGVELLGGEGVEEFLKRRGLTDLAAQYGGEDDASGESDSDGDSPLDQLGAVGERAAAFADRVGSKGVAVAVVLAVALVSVGVLGGPPVPFLGGGDDVSAASTAPENASAAMHVAWNAEVTDIIDPNESDGLAYYPPEGEQFVVVAMNIDNTGDAQVPLKQTAFRFEADGTTYATESLADHDGFLDFPIGPGENVVVWTVFTVPEDVSGTLVYDQNATDADVAVEFERDSSFPVEVTET